MTKNTFFSTVAVMLGASALAYFAGKEGGIKPAAKKLGQSRVGTAMTNLINRTSANHLPGANDDQGTGSSLAA